MFVDALGAFTGTAGSGGPGSAIMNNTNGILPGGNVIDLASVTLSPTLTDIGTGEGLWLHIVVTTAFVGGTTAQFQLASDSTTDLATSRTNHITTNAVPIASLVVGFVIFSGRVPNGVTYERFLGIWETTVGNVTAGQINAFLTKDVAAFNVFPKNYTIS